MKRTLLIVLLGLGTIAGYGASCASLHLHRQQRHSRFEDRVADVCAAAALRVYDQRPQSAPQPTILVPWGSPILTPAAPPIAPAPPAAAITTP